MQYNFPSIFTINRYFIHRIVRIFWKCRWRRNWSWLNWISMDSINCWKTPSWGNNRDYWKFNLQDLMSLNKKVTKKKKPYKITSLCVCLCLPVDVKSLKIYKNNRLFYKVQQIYTWMYYFFQRIAHLRIKNLICTYGYKNGYRSQSHVPTGDNICIDMVGVPKICTYDQCWECIHILGTLTAFADMVIYVADGTFYPGDGHWTRLEGDVGIVVGNLASDNNV